MGGVVEQPQYILHMTSRERFSQRRGFRPKPTEITVREEAPPDLREAVVQIAIECDLSPSQQRKILCRVLRVLPDQGNWSEYPNIMYEVQGLIGSSEWFQVYDYIEALAEHLANTAPDQVAVFAREINRYFETGGIGWQLLDGSIEIRGPEAFEAAVHEAKEATEDRPTTSAEIHEALTDLSRRPEPDLTGALHHSMAALECLARDITGESNATLGQILKANPSLLPKPLDVAVSKVWGFASESGRHVREGHALSMEEVELVVGLTATIVTYLAKKHND